MLSVVSTDFIEHWYLGDDINLSMNSRINDFIEAPHVSSNPILTGEQSAWDSYTRLDDKITDFNYKNDQAHTDLRKELISVLYTQFTHRL